MADAPATAPPPPPLLTPEQESLKERGNDALKSGDTPRAVALFTQALALTGGTTDGRAILLSNRCAALLTVQSYDEALVDADECVQLAPKWPKGWARRGAALFGQREFERAGQAYRTAAGRTPLGADRTRLENLAVQCEVNSARAPDGGAERTPDEWYRAPREPVTRLGRLSDALGVALRALSLLVAVAFALTVNDALYVRSMGFMSVGLALELVARAGVRPSFTQAYGEAVMRNPNAVPALMTFSYVALPGNLAALLSVHLLHTAETGRRVLEYAARASPAAARRVAHAVAGSALVARLVGRADWPTLSPEARWSHYNDAVRGAAARLEIAAFAVVVAQLFTPARNVVGVLVMANVLKLRHLSEPRSAQAWRDVDAALAPLADRLRARFAYDKVKAVIQGFAAPPDPDSVRRGGTGMPRCVVM